MVHDWFGPVLQNGPIPTLLRNYNGEIPDPVKARPGLDGPQGRLTRLADRYSLYFAKDDKLCMKELAQENRDIHEIADEAGACVFQSGRTIREWYYSYKENDSRFDLDGRGTHL